MTEFEQQLKDVLSQAYDIERELGGGGMSRVFVATDRVLGRKIVIKLLSPELLADVNRGRFRREIKVAAQLQHPHIVPLLSAGEHEDLVYYTMPFIAGESLKQSLERNGPMLAPDVIRVLYHVGEALEYAHGEGVVHRDIKPANILRSGTYALVTDFGVAKALNAATTSSGMTSTGMAIGTPAYMAPEQLAGDPAADHRIDIYALGLLAYELLNGRSPFAASTPQRVLAAVLTQDVPPLIDVRPDVPRWLSDIVMICLSKDPADRPESANAVLAALEGFSITSGEIRTQERRAFVRVPTPESSRRVSSTPVFNTPVSNTPVSNMPVSNTPVSNTPVSNTPVSNTPVPNTPVSNAPVTATPAGEQLALAGEPTPTNQGEAVGYDPPKKKSNKPLVGWIVLGLAVAAGAVFVLTRPSGSPNGAVPPGPVAAFADSAAMQPVSPAVAPATAESLAVAPMLDSQAIADSVKRVATAKRVAAKADSLKRVVADSLKRVAAKGDSLNRVRDTNLAKARSARSAVAALLSNAGARQLLSDGATHMGGVLGKKRMGDLQTQINALQPFLKQAGVTYEQFKGTVGESGIKVFDEFGRMVPDSLRRFAGVSR